MRRTSWFRSLAAALAAWFPLVVGEPSLLQPCPTHGAAIVASQSAPAAHHAGAHEGHTAADAAPSHNHDSSPNGDHHTCSCIGCCTSSASSVALPQTLETIDATIIDVPSAVLPSAVELARPAPAFSRPYTTGPPRV